jgi:hypothetical protein
MEDWTQADQQLQDQLDRCEEADAEAKLERAAQMEALSEAIATSLGVSERQAILNRLHYGQSCGHTNGFGLETINNTCFTTNKLAQGQDFNISISMSEHQQLLQKLIDKDLQVAQQSEHIENLLGQLYQLRLASGAGRWTETKLQHALIVLSQMAPFVERARDATLSRSEQATCQVALDAFKELQADDRGPEAGDARPVAEPPLRYLADCQNERAEGVASSQLACQDEGADRAAPGRTAVKEGREWTWVDLQGRKVKARNYW